jgi:hypothetical protein
LTGCEPAEIKNVGDGIERDVGVGSPRPNDLRRRRREARLLVLEISRPADVEFIVMRLIVTVNAHELQTS